jgi:glycosyltransferase involved in cell wall biosynthesis
LGQQEVETEVIVVDDGSEDGTYETVRSKYPEAKVIRNERSVGGAAARNQGAALATFTYLAFLDSDDEWMPTHLSSSICALEEQRADGVFSNFFLHEGIKVTEIVFDKVPAGYTVGESILSNYRFDVRTSTLVFRREVFMKVQFDNALKKHQDWDLATRFGATYRLVYKEGATVKINVDSDHRMSSKLNHEATFYFIEKNATLIRAPFQFNFCLKQLYRMSRGKEDREMEARYLKHMRRMVGQCGIKERLLYFLLRSGLLNVGMLHRAKQLMQKSK